MSAPDGRSGAPTPPYRVVALVHLGIAIVVTVVLGAGLVVASQSTGLVREAYVVLSGIVTEQQLLRDAPFITDIVTTGAIVTGVALLVVGLGAAFMLRRSLSAGARRPAIFAAVLVSVNLLVLPLGLIAAVLLVLEPRVVAPASA